MKNKKTTFSLVITALFCALIVIMTFIPYLGYISYGVLSITTLHVVVILGAVLLGPSSGTVLGFVWGITCLIYALTNGTADAAIFLDPRISVLPRILVGLAAGWYYIGFKKLFGFLKKPVLAETFSAVLTAVFGTLTNTVLVLTAISVFGTGMLDLGATFETIIKTALAINGIVELVLAVVLVTALNSPLRKEINHHSSARR